MERSLTLFCCIFFACGMRSGGIVLFFCVFNALWYFALNTFRVVIYLLCGLPVFIFFLSVRV